MATNYDDMEFTHFVVDNSDGTVFGCARVNGSGKVANFLINGTVRQRSGENWRDLTPDVAEFIKRRAEAAYGRVPTYRTGRLLL